MAKKQSGLLHPFFFFFSFGARAQKEFQAHK